jgi:hypothetical protein
MNKLSFVLLLLFAGWGQMFSQNKFYELIASPDYSFRTSVSETLRNDYEKGRLNFRFGFNINAPLGSRISLKSGLRYAQLSYTTSVEDFRWPSENDGNAGYQPDPFTAYPGTQKHSFRFIELPVMLRYHFSEESKVSLEAGTSINFNIESLWMDAYETNRINLSLNLGIGYRLMKSSSTSLHILPVFRYHLTQTFKTASTEKLYSAGLEFVMKFGHHENQ